MKPLHLALAIAISLINSTAAYAQDKPKEPTREHLAPGLGSGKWKGEIVTLESPLGPAEKLERTEESRPILGGFCYEVKGSHVGPKGKVSTLEIICWDPLKNQYRSTWFDSEGNIDKLGENAYATLEGDTWNFTWKEEKNGKTYLIKQVVKFAPDRKSFTWENRYSEDGAVWTKYSEGRMKKVGKTKASQSS